MQVKRMPQHCRPLLKPAYHQGNQYIDLPYIFKLAQIDQLILYLPNSLKFMGVDFLQSIPYQQLSKFRKLKNKMVCLNGKESQSKQNVSFRSIQNYKWISWDIEIIRAVKVPGKTNSQFQSKQEIKNALKFIDANHGLLKPQKPLKAKTIHQFSIALAPHPSCDYRADNRFINLQKHSLVFVGSIPTGILVDKSDNIEIETLKQVLASDLHSVINIIEKNEELKYRQIKLISQIIPLQTFKSSKLMADELFERLVKGVLGDGRRSGVSGRESDQKKAVKGKHKQEINRGNNGGYLLICCAVLLIIIYFYIRSKMADGGQTDNL